MGVSKIWSLFLGSPRNEEYTLGHMHMGASPNHSYTRPDKDPKEPLQIQESSHIRKRMLRMKWRHHVGVFGLAIICNIGAGNSEF